MNQLQIVLGFVSADVPWIWLLLSRIWIRPESYISLQDLFFTLRPVRLFPIQGDNNSDELAISAIPCGTYTAIHGV
jgi:hypothetical protein